MTVWLYRERHLIAYCVFALFAILGILRVETLSSENRRYMCNFVVDLREREQRSSAYIADVQRGDRPLIPGITLNDLQRSVDGQRATLESFRGLDCG